MTTTKREKLAAACHESWSHWMDHLFRQCETGIDGSMTIPKPLVDRWRRQLKTPYAELTNPEKDSDREQADRMLGAIGKLEQPKQS